MATTSSWTGALGRRGLLRAAAGLNEKRVQRGAFPMGYGTPVPGVEVWRVRRHGQVLTRVRYLFPIRSLARMVRLG